MHAAVSMSVIVSVSGVNSGMTEPPKVKDSAVTGDESSPK